MINQDGPKMIIRQPSGSTESKAATIAGMLLDIPVKDCSFENLKSMKESLLEGALPIGSVEYVREAMRIIGVKEPENLSYPEALSHVLHREVFITSVEKARVNKWFVKPCQTKKFTGFVFDPNQRIEELELDTQEQYYYFLAMKPEERVWASEPVKFLGEWRVYIENAQIIGQARYDPDGEDEVKEPEKEWVEQAIKDWEKEGLAPKAYAMDVGRLENQKLALVEVNDGWALGLYGKSMDAKKYIHFLNTRWKEISKKKPSISFKR